jgi:dTDP-4-amino-4,6-dideoxygalactose transaminase
MIPGRKEVTESQNLQPVRKYYVKPAMALPRAPVISRQSPSAWWQAPRPAGVPTLPYRQWTSSGRAALWQAIRLARETREALTPGAAGGVLVPTYHPRTLIAPVVAQGLRTDFYPLTAEGLPDLAQLDAYARLDTFALVLPHYFGPGRSLAGVRKWCTTRGIALLEDCAHALFGQAGERPVGHWGDYATASLSKFSPTPEAGLLASATHAIAPLRLTQAPWREQLKIAKDLWDHHWLASQADDDLVGLCRRADAGVVPLAGLEPDPVSTVSEALVDGRLGGAQHTAPWLAHLVAREATSSIAAAQRRKHFATYAHYLGGVPDLQCPVPAPTDDSAPYVYPVWFPEAGAATTAYRALRGAGAAVFRWDRSWPQTPRLEDDYGGRWAEEVLQLPCHPSLTQPQVERTALAVAALARHCL